MTLECINPEDPPAPSTYTHVVVATGSRLGGRRFRRRGRGL